MFLRVVTFVVLLRNIPGQSVSCFQRSQPYCNSIYTYNCRWSTKASACYTYGDYSGGSSCLYKNSSNCASNCCSWSVYLDACFYACGCANEPWCICSGGYCSSCNTSEACASFSGDCRYAGKTCGNTSMPCNPDFHECASCFQKTDCNNVMHNCHWNSGQGECRDGPAGYVTFLIIGLPIIIVVLIVSAIIACCCCCSCCYCCCSCCRKKRVQPNVNNVNATPQQGFYPSTTYPPQQGAYASHHPTQCPYQYPPPGIFPPQQGAYQGAFLPQLSQPLQQWTGGPGTCLQEAGESQAKSAEAQAQAQAQEVEGQGQQSEDEGTK